MAHVAIGPRVWNLLKEAFPDMKAPLLGSPVGKVSEHRGLDVFPCDQGELT